MILYNHYTLYSFIFIFIKNVIQCHIIQFCINTTFIIFPYNDVYSVPFIVYMFINNVCYNIVCIIYVSKKSHIIIKFLKEIDAMILVQKKREQNIFCNKIVILILCFKYLIILKIKEQIIKHF